MYVYMHTYMGQEEDVRAAKNAAYKDMDKKRRLLQLHPLSTRDSLMVGHLTCLSPPDRRRLSISGGGGGMGGGGGGGSETPTRHLTFAGPYMGGSSQSDSGPNTGKSHKGYFCKKWQ